MSRPVAILSEGVFVPANVAAAIRHRLFADLQEALRNEERVDDDVADTIKLLDQVGAWWEQKKVSQVSSKVPSVDASSFDTASWITMKNASTELGITPQAVGRLLDRGTLHGVKSGRMWRVCTESVAARRKDNSQCQH